MLPTEKSKPLTDPMQYTTLLYGPTKSGKSTLASNAPGALFLCTEPGTNALDTYDYPIHSWMDLLEACAEIVKGKHEFKTIIIDTIDNAYEFCKAYVLDKNGWKSPEDAKGWGTGWSAINGEFKRVLLRLANTDYGLIVISHSKQRDIEERTGKYTKTVPTLSGKSAEITEGLCDMVLYVDFQTTGEGKEATEERVIRTRATKHYSAGGRVVLPDPLPLDYAEYIKAFNEAMKGNE